MNGSSNRSLIYPGTLRMVRCDSCRSFAKSSAPANSLRWLCRHAASFSVVFVICSIMLTSYVIIPIHISLHKLYSVIWDTRGSRRRFMLKEMRTPEKDSWFMSLPTNHESGYTERLNSMKKNIKRIDLVFAMPWCWIFYFLLIHEEYMELKLTVMHFVCGISHHCTAYA